jgi:hypothetical protein
MNDETNDASTKTQSSDRTTTNLAVPGEDPGPEQVCQMTQLVRYDSMCRAIAECYRVDEVKDIRDKAVALQAYARQAKNLDAERKACVVRMRAERRCGELLAAMPKQHGSRGIGKAKKVELPSSNPGTGINIYFFHS